MDLYNDNVNTIILSLFVGLVISFYLKKICENGKCIIINK